MMESICIFEDEYFSRLYPLTLTRPVFDLRCGISLLREKIARHLPQAQLYYFCRAELASILQESLIGVPINVMPEGDCLFLNGRFLFDDKLPGGGAGEKSWKQNGEVAAARCHGARRASHSHWQGGVLPTCFFEGLPAGEIAGRFIRYPWDLVQQNGAQIKRDFAFFNRGGQILGKVHKHAVLLREENIHLAAGAQIKPGAVLDAEDGPIFIDAGATIMANASLQGPLCVGAQSLIKMGAKIYEGTTIGPVCKVGGEVEESILHAFSNKQHEGFLGHAYLGEWVNLGADTNNSDLKNNYSFVKVYLNGELVDSGSQFVGLFMGDHAKSGINTMFNTGTVVGVMSNVFGAGYPAKFIPSFSWGGAEALEVYALDKALAVARRVMARRKKDLTPAQEQLLRHIFTVTEPERAALRQRAQGEV